MVIHAINSRNQLQGRIVEIASPETFFTAAQSAEARDFLSKIL